MLKLPKSEVGRVAVVVSCLIVLVGVASLAITWLLISPSEAARDLHCETTLSCIAPRHIDEAAAKCSEMIERGADFDVRWLNSPSHGRFTEHSFPPMEEISVVGVVRYRGDSLMLQNGYGAWSRYVYRCDYDSRSGKVLSTEVYRGRLPIKE